MWRLKLQYFSHLIWRADSFEKTLMLRRDDRGWDGWMASPTQWTWVWIKSGSWWWTGRPGVLQSIGSQRVRHNWATELNWMPGNLIQCMSIPGPARQSSCNNQWAPLPLPSHPPSLQDQNGWRKPIVPNTRVQQNYSRCFKQDGHLWGQEPDHLNSENSSSSFPCSHQGAAPWPDFWNPLDNMKL